VVIRYKVGKRKEIRREGRGWEKEGGLTKGEIGGVE